MNASAEVVSRHRLPPPYRGALAVLWLVPLILLTLTALIGASSFLSLLDPRFLLPALLMCLPAAYIWQEGIDVLPGGILRRIHVPRYYPYEQLDSFYLDRRGGRHLLVVRDSRRGKVLEYHAAHLSDLPRLLRALREHVLEYPFAPPER